MSFTNADVAKHAYELADRSRGLTRMAALCVSVAAATTDTICRARAALEIVRTQVCARGRRPCWPTLPRSRLPTHSRSHSMAS